MDEPDIFSSLATTGNPSDMYTSLTKAPPYLLGRSGTTLQFDVTPNITASDVVNGTITRYFARPANLAAGEIIEVAQDQYNILRNIPLYTVVEILWRIAGPLDDILPTALDNAPQRLYTGVITANTLSAKLGDETLPGVGLKLANPVQFYQDKG